jgi:hypothetical protein
MEREVSVNVIIVWKQIPVTPSLDVQGGRLCYDHQTLKTISNKNAPFRLRWFTEVRYLPAEPKCLVTAQIYSR